MKRKLEFIVLATGILSLVYINLFALRASRLADTGREVLLELAPLDPPRLPWRRSPQDGPGLPSSG